MYIHACRQYTLYAIRWDAITPHSNSYCTVCLVGNPPLKFQDLKFHEISWNFTGRRPISRNAKSINLQRWICESGDRRWSSHEKGGFHVLVGKKMGSPLISGWHWTFVRYLILREHFLQIFSWLLADIRTPVDLQSGTKIRHQSGSPVPGFYQVVRNSI